MTTRRLFVAILFLALFTITVREISDPDFWWHLRTGEYILETGTIPHTDPFSFTARGQEWITHEWLSEVFIYTVYRVGGFALLTLVFSGTITLAFALVYLISVGRPYVAGLAMLLGALATAPTWGVRPQMLSLLLAAVFLALLEMNRQRQDWRWLVPLPFLMVLWVNLHSGFALGILILVCYLAAQVTEALVSGKSLDRNHAGLDATVERPSLPAPSFSLSALHSAAPLAVVTGISLLAVLLNPNGARMYVYPFETLASPTMQHYIQEWFSPDFHQLEWLPFALLLFATLGTALLARARVPLAQTLLLLVLGLASLRSVRNIPLFALVAIPVLSAQLAALVPLRASATAPRLARIVNTVLLIVIALVALLRVGSVLTNQAAVEAAQFPQAAVAWIEQNQPAGNLYNAYGWGGYLIWKLYPHYWVYIDGRADVYGDSFIEKYLDVYRAGEGWEDALAAKDVTLVLIEPDAPLASALSASPNWERVFANPQSVIYQKK